MSLQKSPFGRQFVTLFAACALFAAIIISLAIYFLMVADAGIIAILILSVTVMLAAALIVPMVAGLRKSIIKTTVQLTQNLSETEANLAQLQQDHIQLAVITAEIIFSLQAQVKELETNRQERVIAVAITSKDLTPRLTVRKNPAAKIRPGYIKNAVKALISATRTR
ncbi:MAG: hypothetical protein FWC93_01900 [Defluviitaleaceae bacterium]|nr:hypothetical protein [Defluviitaleaceae bacterium]